MSYYVVNAPDIISIRPAKIIDNHWRIQFQNGKVRFVRNELLSLLVSDYYISIAEGLIDQEIDADFLEN